MKPTCRWPVLLAAVMVITQTAGAEQTNYAIGGAGAQELRIGLGARPAAMSGAFVGLADDSNAVNWNPAGLARLRGMQIDVMHNLYFADTSCDFITFAQPWSQSTGIGATIAYYNFGTLDKLDETGQQSATFSPLALQAAVGYGHRVLPGLAWGGSLKYVHEKIDTEQYAAFGLDLGVQWQAPWEVQTGLVAQNLGTNIADSALSRQIKMGIARAVPFVVQAGDVWQTALDVDLPLADLTYSSVHIGTEYWCQNLLALRLGYQIKNNANLAGPAGLATGLGVRYSNFGLDYSLVSFGDLGLTHQLALIIQL